MIRFFGFCGSNFGFSDSIFGGEQINPFGETEIQCGWKNKRGLTNILVT